MSKIVITTASNPTAVEHFEQSVLNGVPLDELLGRPETASHRTIFEAHAADGRVRMWGSVGEDAGRHATTWGRIEFGDWIVFSIHGRFRYAARIFTTLDSAALADAVWGRDAEHGSYRYMTFFDPPAEIDISPASMSAALDYGEAFIYRGFLIPADGAQESLRSKYGSVEEFLGVLTGEVDALTTLARPSDTEEYLNALQSFDSADGDRRLNDLLHDRLNSESPQVVEALTRRIRRDRDLVRRLKALYDGRCQRCGFTFLKRDGTAYSEAAHITPLSTLLAGIDSPDNIVILCANCHRMLDHGGLRIYWKDDAEKLVAELNYSVEPLAENRHIRTGWRS